MRIGALQRRETMAFSSWREWLTKWFNGNKCAKRQDRRVVPRRLRPRLETLECRLAPATGVTDTWTGAVSSNWKDVGNWTTSNSSGLPENGDDLLFPSGVTNQTLTNNLPSTTNSFNS